MAAAPFSISDFVRDPTRLVDVCREVIEELDCSSEDGEQRHMEAQLREIAKAIERLEKAGVPVPDPLRAEKVKLAAELGRHAAGAEALKQLAEDLEDVLRDLRSRVGEVEQSQPATPGEPKKPRRKRKTRQPRTSDTVLRENIIAALRRLGGRGKIADIIELMGKELEGSLQPGDLVWRESTAEYAWQNNAKWERYRMIQEGLLRSDSPRGVWELSEEAS